MHLGKLVILSALVCLSVGSGCVDLEKPAVVQDCARNHQCVNTPTASGGFESAGGTVGSGGEMAGGAGGSAGGNAGAGAGNSGSSSGSGGAGPGGATGRADGGGGAAGSGGAMDGGTADRRDLPAEPRDGTDTGSPAEAGIDEDTNLPAPETPLEVARDVSGAEPDGQEVGRDTEPDSVPALEVSRDLLVPGEPISCIQEFQSNGYAVTVKTDSAILACSDCKENGVSREAACKSMIDCVLAAWPCRPGAGCWTTCLNKSGDMVLGTCVSTLVNEACPAS